MITRLGPYEYSAGNNRFGFVLMSDLHIGADDTDIKRIRKDLDYAMENNCRILLNGDIAELIVFQDRKRYTPNVLDSGIAAQANQVDLHLDMAAEVLAPYASNIDMIGCGNHETAILKYHGTDFTRSLINRLVEMTGCNQIAHGGYSGGLVMNFRRAGADRPSGCHQYKIWYHHGFGGAAPVTKGMIDFSRVDTFVEDSDLNWMGHSHTRTAHQNLVLRFPRQGSDFKYETKWGLRTSQYKKYGKEQITKSGYYKPDWNRERGAPPMPSGGAYLWLTATDHALESEVILGS